MTSPTCRGTCASWRISLLAPCPTQRMVAGLHPIVFQALLTAVTCWQGWLQGAGGAGAPGRCPPPPHCHPQQWTPQIPAVTRHDLDICKHVRICGTDEMCGRVLLLLPLQYGAHLAA